MELLSGTMALLWESVQVTKRVAGSHDTPAPYHATAAIFYKDQAALDAFMALAGSAFEDDPDCYSGQPIAQIGEVLE